MQVHLGFKPTSRDSGIERDVPLFSVLVAIVLVPLIPLHFLPDLQFYPEAIFFVLVSMGLLGVKGHRLVPVSLGGPIQFGLALIGLTAAANAVLGRAIGPQMLLMPAYCLFAGVTYLFLKSILRGQSGPQQIEALAIAIAISGLVACIPAAFQLSDSSPHPLIVMQRGGKTTLFGNMSQANLFADWIWLSLLAMAFLVSIRRIRGPVFLAAAATLVTFALTTGSRSVWLYPVVAVAGVMIFRSADRSWRIYCKWISAALALQLLLHFVWREFGWYEYFGLTNSQARVMTEMNQLQAATAEGSIRGNIWRRSIVMILESPWFGWGPGSFRFHALRVLAEVGGRAPVGEHAHNLFLQLAAELGIPLSLMVLGVMIWWGVRASRKGLQLSGQWAIASLAVVLVHSLLEYPLWFAHFLGIAMVFAAVVDREVDLPGGTQKHIGVPIRLFGVIGITAAIALSFQHSRIEAAFNEIAFQKALRLGGQSGFAELNADTLEGIDDIPKWSPWRGYAELALLYGGNPAPEHAAQWAPLCRQVLYFDAPPVVFARCAMLLQLTGSHEGAQRFAQWGCAGYSRPQDGFPLILRHVAQTMGVTELPAATCLAP